MPKAPPLAEDGQQPGCPVVIVFFFSSAHASMMLAVLPSPLVAYWTADYPWLPVVFFLLLLMIWFSGMALLMRLMGRLWSDGQRGLVGALVLACWGVAACCLWIMMTQMPSNGRFTRTLGPHAQEYWDLKGEGAAEGTPTLRGKCVILFKREGAAPLVDAYSQGQLPRSIRAESPEEVRTVIQGRYGKEAVPGVEGAWVDTCEVTLIDGQNKRLIGKKLFKGKWRETTQKGKGKVWVGWLDAKEVRDWLLELPREP